jgi:UDP-N-acetylmuramate--alanine ligase
LNEVRHIHFIGIGGVGMSGLAAVLLARGSRVSGSDPQENTATNRLKASGSTIYSQQVADNISREKPDLVVCTAAIHDDNPELHAARTAGIPIVSRAEFLGRVMAEHSGPRIAVTGTHGKTTTTAMLASVLMSGGLDPTVLVGGEYAGIGGNVRVGSSGAFLTEACEAYDSFLSLKPDIAVITNIEADHLDYYHTEDRVLQSFANFVNGIRQDGIIIACGDDPGVQRLHSQDRPDIKVFSYGLASENQLSIQAANIVETPIGSKFDLLARDDDKTASLGAIQIPMPGAHNVLNALGAVAVGLQLDISFETMALALAAFKSPERRFEILGEIEGITVVDDYAHHPTEIRATLAAARTAFPYRRIIVAFQPHLYSRTRDFLDDFASELSQADVILVSDIYAAREDPIPGIHATGLVRKLAQTAPGKSVIYAGGLAEVPDRLAWIARPGDVVFSMGAGDIRRAGETFVELLMKQRGDRSGKKAEEVLT